MELFSKRHIGPRNSQIEEMVKTCGFNTLDELIESTIPDLIRSKDPLNLDKEMSEYEYLNHINDLAKKNKIYKTYIGLGYHDTILPSVIKRNILENPGWYTAYTPYQAEISQGRLEALLNFQTMVIDLTGLEIANASLLDESTAAAEAMIMFFNSRSKEAKKNNAIKFLVSDQCHPQNIDVVITRAIPLGIEVIVANILETTLDNSFFGVLLQYPETEGNINDYSAFSNNAHELDIYVGVAADIMSLALLEAPGNWGADAVFGTTQRFGIPMGYGGPHAAYFSTKESFKRHIPGRIIGVSIDSEGNSALRMALQTREQHIKRDRATSNICTAQVLLAVMAGMYAVYHGSDGIHEIASEINRKTNWLNNQLKSNGFNQLNESFFDTLLVECDLNKQAEIKKNALNTEINLRYFENGNIGIAINEPTDQNDLKNLAILFGAQSDVSVNVDTTGNSIPVSLNRQTDFLTHEIFNTFHSETEMMRYIKRLENKDLSLTHSMIPLGSCTMKLNAASELFPLSWPEF
jgi:glycine dehydrogenase